MSRPFISSSVDQLEESLEQAISKQDDRTIRLIASELTHRRVPRARELADRIKSLGRASGQRRMERSIEATTRAAPKQVASVPKGEFRRPTDEQQSAIDAFASGGSLRINAYAGTGKTSTLQMLAHISSRRGQYIAFNKAIVGEAKQKFPAQVDCSTTHGLAYRATSSVLRQNSGKMTGRVSAQKLADILSIRKAWRIDEDHVLQPRSQAYLILETIKKFAQSEDEVISGSHVPRHGSLVSASEESLAAVSDFARRGAEHVWHRMCDPGDDYPLGHDGYLKLWAMSQPTIQADYILLDEAQDTNPVVLGVLRRQAAQLVYVGDRYQQIYEWRGAVNAMEAIDTDHSVRLTRSFRFGTAIAAEASRLLSQLGETAPLQGNPGVHSRVGECKPDAILARTNASVISALVNALNDGRSPHLVGGSNDLLALLRGVADLKANTPSDVPDFFGFSTWDQVLEFAGTAEGQHLATFTNLVQSRGERQLMWALNRAVDEERSDLVLSTAHKAKGREWNAVRLMDDFLKSRPRNAATKEEKEKQEREEAAELRLYYVAVTRAREVIQLPEAQAGREPEQATKPQPVTSPRATPAPTEARSATAQDRPKLRRPADWVSPSSTTPTARSAPPPLAGQTTKKGFFARLFGR